jgi:integrase
MARLQRTNKQTGVRINTAEARARLPQSITSPHWVPITPGTSLGYFKGARGGTWWVRQRVGARYVKQSIGTADDHMKADGDVVLTHKQAVERAVGAKLQERRVTAPRNYADGQTLNDVIEYYLGEQLVDKGSEMSTRLAVGRHIRDDIGVKLVTAIDADVLRKWHRGLTHKAPSRRHGAGKTSEHASFDPKDPEQMRSRKATANRILTIVKAALNFAWRHDKLPADLPSFWQKVEPFPLGDDPPPRMLDQGEITRLLNAASRDLRELLTGALMTGARYGELCALQVRDFSPERGAIIIRQGKTNKTLTQPLSPEGVRFFERLTAGRSAMDIIFKKVDGTSWGKSHVARPVKEAVAAAKLNDVSFKVTRATYGKLLLLATKDIEMVARALGHSDSRITRKHYAQILPDELARAVATMPALGVVDDRKVTPIKRRRA